MSDPMFGSVDFTQPNVFGGMNGFDASGHMQTHSTPNVFGGMDFHDAGGMTSMSSMPNVFGGQDFTAGGQHMFSTQPGATGMNLMDGHGQMTGTFSSFGPDLSFHDMQGNHTSWHQNTFGGYSADPLSNMGAVQFPSMLN